MSLMVDIADAVVAQINAGTFSEQFEAGRVYLPQYDMTELEQVRVTVVPRTLSLEPGTRGAHQHVVTVEVAVQKRVPDLEPAKLDDLCTLVQEIVDEFLGGELAALPGVMVTDVTVAPTFAPEHLEEKGTFTSLITLACTCWRLPGT